MTVKERIAAIIAWVTRIVEWVMRLRPVRVWFHYLERRGPLLSAGLSYQSIFAVFAGLWVGFAVAGVVLRSRPDLLAALVDLLERNVPGLIDDGSGTGALDPNQLLEASILGWTGAIAAGVLFVTALGWLGSGREAVRVMFDLKGVPTNPILVFLKDTGLALAFGAALVASAALTVLATSAVGVLLGWVGVDSDSTVAALATRGAVLIVVLVLDTVVLGLFYRVVASVKTPLRRLLPGTLIAATALGVLKVLGTSLLGGATNNPLLASFAVIIGLLIWFNLVCQVILLGAAWIAVGVRDRAETVEDMSAPAAAPRDDDPVGEVAGAVGAPQ
jgi:membrane protein